MNPQWKNFDKKSKYRSRKWEKIFEQDPEDREYEKIYDVIQKLTILEERSVASKVYFEKLEKKRQEEEKLIEKWINILEKDSNESEYNKLQNNKKRCSIDKGD